MNNSIVDTVLSREELLAFMLPVFSLSVIGIVANGVIVYLYVRYKTLRAEGGVHIMALLALFDLLYSVTALHVCLERFFAETRLENRCRPIVYTNSTPRLLSASSSASSSALCGRV